MQTKIKLTIIALSLAMLAGLLSCSPKPRIRHQIQYSHFGDRIFCKVISQDCVTDSYGHILYLYNMKGDQDVKTFDVSSWNNYKVGTEIELSDEDSIEGCY